MTYCTLNEAKAELKATTTTDDAKLMNLVRTASNRIDGLMQSRRPYFAPVIEQREIVIAPSAINTWLSLLYFDAHLLTLSAAAIGTTVLVVGTDIDIWTPLASPSHAVRLLALGNTWYDYCGGNTTPQPNRLLLTGIWGFNRDYANAWLSADTLQAAIATSSVTTLTVADVDGLDAYNRSPRIAIGNLLRIDTEFLEVVNVNTGTNVVTVKRGVNGSTAATHNNGTAVEVWQVEETIKYACARFAAFLYARQGAFETINVTDLGSTAFPSDVLAAVKGIVNDFAYE